MLSFRSADVITIYIIFHPVTPFCLRQFGLHAVLAPDCYSDMERPDTVSLWPVLQLFSRFQVLQWNHSAFTW